MIYTRQGLQLEMCMSPRHFDLGYLLEYKIIREVAGSYTFYESGKAASKLHTRVVLQEGDEQVIKAKDEDKETVGWLVSAHLSLETKVDKLYTMVHDMWKSFKEEQDKKKKAEKTRTDLVDKVNKESDHGETKKDDQEENAAGRTLEKSSEASKARSWNKCYQTENPTDHTPKEERPSTKVL